MKSLHAVLLVSFIWVLLGSFYYPKWNKPGSEAQISWDVAGYYHYLPAIFIYHDLKQQDWINTINEKYLPSPAYDQAIVHEKSGHKVNKYAIGQAVLYSPFFFAAHAYANLTNTYPADGYSKPYQIAIWFGSLCFAILGLFLLRRILLLYFDETLTFWTILAIGLATNYVEYAAINNGMNHAWLFTLLCVLILSSIRFYQKADWKSAIGIGVSLGLAVLVRPTELIWIFIPLLWGMTSFRERLKYLKLHWQKIAIAIVLCGLMMSMQAAYWKYASGEWVVYSYGQQGFNWLHPNIRGGLIGVKIGWWAYTPMMLFAMVGWFGLYKKHKSIFWPILITSVLAMYLTFAWAHFAEGGGLGQRNLIQIYPLIAFPLAMAIAWLSKIQYGKWIWGIFFLLNLYYNGWWIHQAHKGGFFQATQMTTPYFINVVGRLHPDRDYFKLLDTREYFKGEPKLISVLLENNFNADTTTSTTDMAAGDRAIVLNQEHQFYGPVSLPVSADCFPWIRFEGDFTIRSHEWDLWKYAQWIVQFYQDDVTVKTNLIRVQRLITADQTSTRIFFDVKVPAVPYNRCTMTLWNADSPNTLLLDNLRVSCFR